jgi:hypothetical protein
MRPHVLIAVPHMGTMVTGLTRWLTLQRSCPEYDISLYLPPRKHIPHDTARNSIVQFFLSTECTHLLQVDSDVVPPDDAVARLLAHGVEIVAGLSFVLKGEGISVNCGNDDGKGGVVAPIFQHGDPPLTHVDYAGGGCVFASREVFKRFWESKWPPYEFVYKNGIMVMGEDFKFCLNAKVLGLQVFVDRSVLCKHYKTVELSQMNQLLSRYWREGKHHVNLVDNGDGDNHGDADGGEGAPHPG